MGIVSKNYHALQNDIYSNVPEVSCQACGQCCVSPHMTLVEFCYMLTPLLDTPESLAQTVSRVVAEHPDYPGQLTCRFQTSGKLCSVHSHRPLACRMHGHSVLKEMGDKYHVHCQKAETIGKRISPEDVYGLLDGTNAINQRIYDHYTPPYWVCGLTVESWLTIVFEEIPQQLFRTLKTLIAMEYDLEHLAETFTQTVRLREKLVLIDRFQAALQKDSKEGLLSILEKIQNDFPETGAYYYFEADMYKEKLMKEQGC